MQRTVRLLRIALPIVFLAFIALIAFNWNKTRIRRDKEATRPVVGTRTGETPQAEAKEFDDTQTIGGRVVSRIRAKRVVAYSSNWTTLEDVQMTIYRPNNLTYEIVCPSAQFNSTSKEADAKGGVKVTSSDGIEIQTAEIKFDGNRLTNDIPVTFKIDRWTGKGGALDLDVQGETLRLFKKVEALMTPEAPAEAPMTLAGEETIFRRRENDVTFTQKVEIHRAADSMKADRAVGRFTQDRRRLIGFEGAGNAEIVMASNPQPGEDLGGRKTITSDGFNTEVGPNGEIVAINAWSAEHMAHAVLDGPPKRDIVARGFRVALANRAVSEIRADFSVVMKEFADVLRTVQAEHVNVLFDSNLHRAMTANLEGGFRYQDPKTTATAFRANYDIGGDRIVLTTDPGWDATVISDGQVVKAKQIEFSPKAQTAKAVGDVIAQLSSKGNGPSADATNIFPSGKPVFVNSDQLLMRQQTKVAVFSGNVRAWQETNTVLANEMQITGMGSVVTARGNVQSMLYNVAGDGRKSAVNSTSDTLTARKGDRRIDLAGNVTIKDETRTLTSEKASFFFDGNKKIERIEAEDKVNVVEKPTSRSGTGDKAIYQVSKKLIYVNGKPATMKDPTGSVSGEQIVFDLTRNKVQVVSPTGPTSGTYKHPG